MSQKVIKTISTQSLLRIFKDQKQCGSEESFAFVTGAGASAASGIPSGIQLAQEWLQEIKEDYSTKEFDDWKKIIEEKETLPFTENNIGQFYSHIFKQRFVNNQQSGYDALFKAMENAEPSLGYITLAQIMDTTRNNIVLTTNFDSLLESSLYQFTRAHPLILGHESLANYVRPNSERPTVIKIHRDLLMDPINDEKTGELSEQWKEALKPIITQRALIVIGYGGNDGSLMNYLNDIADRQGIYWCCRKPKNIPDKVRELLTHKQDRLVQIKDFDIFMASLGNALNLEPIINPDDKYSGLLWKNTEKQHERYSAAIEGFADTNPIEADNMESIKRQLPDWWDYQHKIDQEKNHDKKQALYERGIKELHSSELMGNYAIFLTDIRTDYDKAETYYLKVLKVKPEHTNNNSNYANFLRNVRKNYAQAEAHYLKALKTEPEHASINGNYANFLTDIYNDHDKAKAYYLRALKAEPEHVNNNGNYANFLTYIKKDYSKAETYYLKALNSEPENAHHNGNYANFLTDIRKNHNKAETYYLKSLEAEPDNANHNNNYANFLRSTRKDYDKSETYYLKSLEVESENAINNGNYAGFLMSQNQYQKALSYWEKSLKNAHNQKSLLTELWFYRLAHCPEDKEVSLEKLDQLLAEGAESPHWNFDNNIEQAAKAGTANIHLLKDYAERISGEEHDISPLTAD